MPSQSPLASLGNGVCDHLPIGKLMPGKRNDFPSGPPFPNEVIGQEFHGNRCGEDK